MVPGPTQVLNPNGSSIGAAVFAGLTSVTDRGVARNSFWVGIIFLPHDTTVVYTSSLTASAAISAQNNFQGLILGGFIYRYTPRRYAPGDRQTDRQTTLLGR